MACELALCVEHLCWHTIFFFTQAIIICYMLLQGRPFAWQEMLLILASIIQRFDIFMVDPSYTLQLQQALTVKPKDFYIRVAPRAGKSVRLYSLTSSNI
jgi:hypothetical protein